MRDARDELMVPMTPISTVKVDLSMPSPSPISVATGVSWEEHPPQTPMKQEFPEMTMFGQQRHSSHHGKQFESTPRTWRYHQSFASMSTLSESPMSTDDFTVSPYYPTPSKDNGLYHWHANAGVDVNDEAPKLPTQPRRTSIGGSVLSSSTPSTKEIADRMNRQRPLLLRRASMGSLCSKDVVNNDRFATGCEDSQGAGLGSAPRSNASVHSRSRVRHASGSGSSTRQSIVSSNTANTNVGVRRNRRKDFTRGASMSSLKDTKVRMQGTNPSPTRWEGGRPQGDSLPKLKRQPSNRSLGWSGYFGVDNDDDSQEEEEEEEEDGMPEPTPERSLPHRKSSSKPGLAEAQTSIRRSKLTKMASANSLLDGTTTTNNNNNKPRDTLKRNKSRRDVTKSTAMDLLPATNSKKSTRSTLTRRSSTSQLLFEKKRLAKGSKKGTRALDACSTGLLASSSTPAKMDRPSRRNKLTRRASCSDLSGEKVPVFESFPKPIHACMTKRKQERGHESRTTT